MGESRSPVFLSLCPGNEYFGGGYHQTERFPPQGVRRHHPRDVALYQFLVSGKGASLLSDYLVVDPLRDEKPGL